MSKLENIQSVSNVLNKGAKVVNTQIFKCLKWQMSKVSNVLVANLFSGKCLNLQISKVSFFQYGIGPKRQISKEANNEQSG